MGNLTDKIQLLPIIVPALIMSLILHELAHAVVGDKLGDPTPREQGRLTLNPLKHLDPFGSAFFVFTFLFTGFSFGWAKPVQIRTDKLRGKHKQRAMGLVAIAGPIVNFVIAFVVLTLVVRAGLGGLWQGDNPNARALFEIRDYWDEVIFYVMQINIVLGIFNLIPIPPLDGSRVAGAFMPKSMHDEWAKLDQYAPLFLIILIVFLQDSLGSLLRDGFIWVFDLMLRVLGVL